MGAVKLYLIASFVAALVLCATAELPSEGSDALDVNVLGEKSNIAEVEDLRLKREAMPEPKKKKARKGNNGNGKKHNNGKSGNRRQNVKKNKGRNKNINQMEKRLTRKEEKRTKEQEQKRINQMGKRLPRREENLKKEVKIQIRLTRVQTGKDLRRNQKRVRKR